jgi:hypothetical protein
MQIMNFLEEVVAANPDIATVETYGQSTEGRDLKVIRIGTPGANKTAFFLDGGTANGNFCFFLHKKHRINFNALSLLNPMLQFYY